MVSLICQEGKRRQSLRDFFPLRFKVIETMNSRWSQLPPLSLPLGSRVSIRNTIRSASSKEGLSGANSMTQQKLKVKASWFRWVLLSLFIVIAIVNVKIFMSHSQSNNIPASTMMFVNSTIDTTATFSRSEGSHIGTYHEPTRNTSKHLDEIVEKNDKSTFPRKSKITSNVVHNPTQSSKYAYVTLISGLDSSFRYRGFLYNTMIIHKALTSAGSTADFIALIGYGQSDTEPFEEDMNLLRSKGIIIHTLQRLLPDEHVFTFAEMALLKVTPWSFDQYDRVQFFDGDVMPTSNMDCFFRLDINTFTVGLVSPLNSGWYLAIPNKEDYNYLIEKAKWRLGLTHWDADSGWKEALPDKMFYRGGRVVKKWEFNGADMDQGLLTHYFIINRGKGMLIDTDLRLVRHYSKGILHKQAENVPMDKAIACCEGKIPTSFFVHFTGRSKPWMQDFAENKNGRDIQIWLNHLDNLMLPVNSTNLASKKLGSPLGFFNTRLKYKKKE